MATGIGETLREARQRQGLSLEDASAETRIRATHLAALEREEFDALGGDVYVRGFLKSYAKLLGVDPQPLLQLHREQAEQAPEPEAPPPLHHEPVDRTPRRGAGVVVAVVALAVLVGLALWDGDDADEVAMDDDPAAELAEDDEAAEPPDDEGEGNDDSEAAEGEDTDVGDEPGEEDDTEEAEPTPSPTPTPLDGLEVVLEVTEREAWIQALVDGDEVMQGTLTAPASETFEGDDEVRIRIGDPSAVELTINGEDHGSPGEPGVPVWVTVDADGEVSIS